MNDEAAPTNGLKQDEEKPAPTAGLSSLVAATAHMLTVLSTPGESSSAPLAESPSQTQNNSSSPLENVAVSPTIEAVTKSETQVNPKQTKEKLNMTTLKKKKAEKKMTVARMLQRLDKVKTFERLAVKMGRWLEDEKDEARRLDLETLKQQFELLTAAQYDVRLKVISLQDANYVPPKKNFSGAMQLEHGRQVWVKPKFAQAYLVALPKDAVNNLFVDQTIGSKVVVSIGSPDEAIAFKLPIPKLHLQVTATPIAA